MLSKEIKQMYEKTELFKKDESQSYTLNEFSEDLAQCESVILCIKGKNINLAEIIQDRTKLLFIDLKEQNKIIDRIFQRSFDQIKTKEFYVEINGLNLFYALLQDSRVGLSFLFENHGITKINIEVLLANVDYKYSINNNFFENITGYKEKFYERNQIRLWIIILMLTMALLTFIYN